jgi:hypothetical protein
MFMQPINTRQLVALVAWNCTMSLRLCLYRRTFSCSEISLHRSNLRLRTRARQRNWQLQHNRNFRETSPVSSRQLVSRLAGAHWGNLRMITCSHHLNWVCSSDLMRDFMRFASPMWDNITDPVTIWWCLRRHEKRGRRPWGKYCDVY